jgi:hypothetical protein
VSSGRAVDRADRLVREVIRTSKKLTVVRVFLGGKDAGVNRASFYFHVRIRELSDFFEEFL